MAGVDTDLEAQSQRLPPPERPPSLLEKIANLRQAWQSVPTAEIRQKFEEKNRWSSEWDDYWLDCVSPLVAEFLDGMEMVSQRNGDVWLAPTARRCGKTTLGMMLERFCTTFSTPEKPLPQFYFFNPLGVIPDLNSRLEQLQHDEGEVDSAKVKDIIREQFILRAVSDLMPTDVPPEEGLSTIKTILEKKDVIFLDEAGALEGLPNWTDEDRATTLLSSIEVLKELCPRAIIFVTTGHSLAEGATFEQLFNRLYEKNRDKEHPLEMFERGLRDAWNTDTVMADFFGREKVDAARRDASGFDFREDSATFQAWLVNHVTVGLRGYFNPYILERYFESYASTRREFAETTCLKLESQRGIKLTEEARLQTRAEAEANFEKAVADLNCLDIFGKQKIDAQDSARKLLTGQSSLRHEGIKATPVKLPSHRLYSLKDQEIRTIAKAHQLDPQVFFQTIDNLRDYFEFLYGHAITDVLLPDALILKLKIAEMVEGTLATGLLTERGRSLQEQAPEQILADFWQILSGTEFSLRAKGAGVKHRDILLPEPKTED